MPVRVPVVFSNYLSAMDLLQLPTFCSCNNLHDRSAIFCISVLQKTFEATKKWTMPVQNWGKVYGELAIMYDGRLPE